MPLNKKILFICILASCIGFSATCLELHAYFRGLDVDCMNKIYLHRDYDSKKPFLCDLKKTAKKCKKTKKNFIDDCGCGCECDYINLYGTKRYETIDWKMCKYKHFACGEGEERFENACGCGCRIDQSYIEEKKFTHYIDRCNQKGKFRHYLSKEPDQCPKTSVQCPEDATAFSDECGCGCEVVEGPAFTLYTILPDEYKDCGFERKDLLDREYNKKMRRCFLKAYNKCDKAKIYQKKYSPDGKPISITGYTTGRTIDGQCEMKIFNDSRESPMFNGKLVTSCYSAHIKTLFKAGSQNEERDFLNVGECRDLDNSTFYF